MIRAIVQEFKEKQGVRKAKWVYNYLRPMRKEHIAIQYENFIIKGWLDRKVKEVA